MLTKVHCESEKSLLYIISTHCDFGCTRSPHFLRGSCPPFSTIFVVSSKNQLKLFSLLLGSCQSRNVLKEHSYVDKKRKKVCPFIESFWNLFHKSRWWIENLINVWSRWRVLFNEVKSFLKVYHLRRPQNFAKSSPYFCPM